MEEFDLVKAGIHVDQRDKGNPGLHMLVFRIEAKWLGNPDCMASLHVKANYNVTSKVIDHVEFRGEPEVPVATPLPAWFGSFSKFLSKVDWTTASPRAMVKGLDAFLKKFAEKGS
jgi:hypothetical protein